MTRDGAAAARVAHNHEVPGSSPGPATKKKRSLRWSFFLWSEHLKWYDWTMTSIEQVQTKVRDLYTRKNPHRAEWADWLYDNHVLVVAKTARELAQKYSVNEDLSEAAALLHDIADVEMERADPTHEERSLALARQIMTEAGFAPEEITLVVDDAIRYHSCHGDERPKSQEGLILATADSLAHLQTDFYVYAVWVFGKTRSLEDVKVWTLRKIERDLNNKISFDDEREVARPDYEMIKQLFSR